MSASVAIGSHKSRGNRRRRDGEQSLRVEWRFAGSTAGDAIEGGLTRDGEETEESCERRDEWHVERERDVPRDERESSTRETRERERPLTRE